METLGNEKGDTYFYKEEIFKTLRVVINYEPDISEFENALKTLIENLKIIEPDGINIKSLPVFSF